MDRRSFLKMAGMAAGAGMLGPALSGQEAGSLSGRPNIVFIFSDDHAQHAIGAYGGWLSDVARTPNIDRLAAQGALFTQSFCTNSICAPSRATVLTGKFAHLNGQRTNGDTFDGSQTTFPKLLQAAGYTTAMIGKWHLRSDPTGFDHWEILPGQGSYYNPDLYTAEGTTRYPGYVSDIITDLALDWLDAGRDPQKPFLLMYQHKAPHRNWMPPPNHLTTYDDVELPDAPNLFMDYANQPKAVREQEMEIGRHMEAYYDLKIGHPDFGLNRTGEFDRMTDEQKAAWDAAYRPKNEAMLLRLMDGQMSEEELLRWKYQRYVKDYLRTVTAMDDNIGRLLDYLDAQGLASNTIVIYASDQGFFLGDRGWYDKRWIYEESLRMPFIVRWPGRVEPGTRIDALIQNIDYAPTLLEAAGVAPPPDMQGRSLLPLFDGNTPPSWRTAIYYHYYEYPRPHRVAPHYGIRTHDGKKLFHFYHEDHREWQMTDLSLDAHELHNLYGVPKYADVQGELRQLLRQLQEQYADPIANAE